MITIKQGDRGWVNPKSWEEVLELPGYQSEVDPKAVKLEAVIGKYREADYRVCGLSNCHTKHYRGYIVSTVDGRLTNIGVDCGKKHFGVDFETMSRTLDREVDNQERRETITAAKARIEPWTSQCDQLLRQASSLWKEHRLAMDPIDGFPRPVVRVLHDLMRTGSTTLTRERTATKREQEIARELGQANPAVIQEEVGTLRGLAGIAALEELRSVLAKDLDANLPVLAQVDVLSASEQDLRHWAKWSGEVDSKLTRARVIVEEAKRFFDRENIAQLAELCMDRADEKAVMAVAKRYP